MNKVIVILLLAAAGIGGYLLLKPKSGLEKFEAQLSKMESQYQSVAKLDNGQPLPEAFAALLTMFNEINTVLATQTHDCQGLMKAYNEINSRFQQSQRNTSAGLMQLAQSNPGQARQHAINFLARFYPVLQMMLPLMQNFVDICPTEGAILDEQLAKAMSR